MTRPPSVPERLRDAATLFEERNAQYGANYTNFGKVMEALFPNGISVTGPVEMRRLSLVVHMMTKLTRYCNNFWRGGHTDSLEDLSVYAQMTSETDAQARVEEEMLAELDEIPEESVDPFVGVTTYSDLQERIAARGWSLPTVDQSVSMTRPEWAKIGRQYGWLPTAPTVMMGAPPEHRAGPPTPREVLDPPGGGDEWRQD